MQHTISVLVKNEAGALSRMIGLFSARGYNIESLTVSESAIKGVSKFTIVVETTEEQVQKIVQQIEKQVDVLKAFYHHNDELVYQEIALYKVATNDLLESDKIENLIRKYNARILEITKEFTVIEKTGHKEETQEFFEELNQFRVLQFIRSGRIAITRLTIERLSEFLNERDKILSTTN